MPGILFCDVSLTASIIPPELSETAVVIIDVLRATTTIVHALHNGARGVVPCEEPADALAMRERLGAEWVVLGGERDSVRIPGFDLDNSPASYTRETIEGKTIAFTTTNGTRAMRRAMRASALTIFCGAFANVDAVVQRLHTTHARSVLLACAGDEGAIALEDVLLAGRIAQTLTLERQAHLSDAAKTAVLAYTAASNDLSAAISSSEHAHALVQAGFAGDIALAAQLNTASVVPILHPSGTIEVA